MSNATPIDLTAVPAETIDRLLGRSDQEPTFGDASEVYRSLGLEAPPFVHLDPNVARALATGADYRNVSQ